MDILGVFGWAATQEQGGEVLGGKNDAVHNVGYSVAGGAVVRVAQNAVTLAEGSTCLGGGKMVPGTFEID